MKRAVLLCINFNDPEDSDAIMHTFFDGDMCWRHAEQLREGIKDDWPDHTFRIVCNDAAREEMGKVRTDEMLDL